MSELLTETVSFEVDEQGKPTNLTAEPGSAVLDVNATGECLVEQADPGVDLGSANCPKTCDTCKTTGFIQGGIYFSTISVAALSENKPVPFCGRYQQAAEQEAVEQMSFETIRELARWALGEPQPVARTKFDNQQAA